MTERTAKRILGAAVIFFFACAVLSFTQARAQTAGTINFTAATTTGAGSVVPSLTWSTTPAATQCVASGDWSGNKGASGTETLAAITAGKTYNLTCTWPAGTTATLRWVAPTKNTDGSDYTDPNGYIVSWGTSPTALTQTKPISNTTTLSNVIDGLTPAKWYFAVQARNMAGVLSAYSAIASKVIAAGTASEAVGITVNPKPNAPSALTVE